VRGHSTWTTRGVAVGVYRDARWRKYEQRKWKARKSKEIKEKNKGHQYNRRQRGNKKEYKDNNANVQQQEGNERGLVTIRPGKLLPFQLRTRPIA